MTPDYAHAHPQEPSYMTGTNAYGRNSPMVASSNARALPPQSEQQHQPEEQQGGTLWRILTCRCG